MKPYNNITQAIEKLNLNNDIVDSLFSLASALDSTTSDSGWDDAVNTRFMNTACLVLGISVPEFYSGVWDKFPLPDGAKMPGHVLRVAIISAAGLDPK